MYDEIVKDINERLSTHANSMCATGDEVRICWLVAEVERLRNVIAGTEPVVTRVPVTLDKLAIIEKLKEVGNAPPRQHMLSAIAQLAIRKAAELIGETTVSVIINRIMSVYCADKCGNDQMYQCLAMHGVEDTWGCLDYKDFKKELKSLGL